MALQHYGQRMRMVFFTRREESEPVNQNTSQRLSDTDSGHRMAAQALRGRGLKESSRKPSWPWQA